jgi:hypothetical protein
MAFWIATCILAPWVRPCHYVCLERVHVCMSQAPTLKTFLNFERGGGENYVIFTLWKDITEYSTFYFIVCLCNLPTHNEASSCLFSCSIFIEKRISTTLEKCMFHHYILWFLNQIVMRSLSDTRRFVNHYWFLISYNMHYYFCFNQIFFFFFLIPVYLQSV